MSIWRQSSCEFSSYNMFVFYILQSVYDMINIVQNILTVQNL